MKKLIYIISVIVLFAVSCKEEETVYVPSKELVHDSVNVNTVKTILTYDTIRKVVIDTVRYYTDSTVINYDTVRTYKTDTIVVSKYDTIRTYQTINNYDTIRNHQTIYHYDTVRIVIYDTLSVILNPDGTLKNQSWVIYISNAPTKSVDSVKVINGESITLKTNIARTGYNLLHWNTQPDGNGTSYNPGDEFTVNQHFITLYAIWQSRTGVRVSELFDYLRNNYSSNMTIKIIDLNPDVKSIVSAIDKFKGLVNYVTLDLSDAIALESLDESTFANWKTLYSIKLPQNLKTIDHAFDGCSNLSAITIPENVETLNIDNWSVSKITVPQQVRSLSIVNCANLTSISFDTESLLETFKCNYCPNLTSINIPNSVTKFDGLAGCSKITKCLIPSNVKDMHMNFEGCTNLNTLVHNLDNCSGVNFKNCSNLKSLSIPEGCTEIKDSAFYGCTKLSVVDIPESVVKIGKYAFMNCSNLTSIKLPEKLTCIENCTFNTCSQLTSVIMPDSLKTIGNQVFANCTSLNTVSIPKGVMTIGDYAFYSSNLSSIVIPENVVSIGQYAFYNCNNLSKMFFKSGIPPELSNYSLKNTKNTTIFVPLPSLEAYQNANGWSIYSCYGVPFFITGCSVENVDKDGNILLFYASNSQYLRPTINYECFGSGDYDLYVKVYNSYSSLSRGTSSPSGYSYVNTLTMDKGSSSVTLGKWGNSSSGHWSAGNMRYEFYIDGYCIYTYYFNLP